LSEPQAPLASPPKPVQPATPLQATSQTPQQSTSAPSVAAESSSRAAGPSQLWDLFVASDEPLEARRLWTVRLLNSLMNEQTDSMSSLHNTYPSILPHRSSRVLAKLIHQARPRPRTRPFATD
jgi:hypothetical protein